jgi:hypothetical protein
MRKQNRLEKGPAENVATPFSHIRRGTGPRTELGKERTRHNATKHGILSGRVVLPGESQAEFSDLVNGLHDVFEPMGAFEEGLVEMLAVTRWRQRRLFIAEAAEIEAGREFIEWDERQRQLVEAGRISEVIGNGGLVRQIANPEALERCLDLLEELRRHIEQYGFDFQDESILTKLYGEFDNDHWEDTLLNAYWVYAGVARVPDHIRERGEFSSPKEYKEHFLQELAAETKRLERYKKERASIECNRMKLESLRRNVPDSPRLDQLLRYSASLERTFDRTLNHLERAQRMRLGQPVPPPINVNVSS